MPLTKPLRGRLPRRTHPSFGNNWIGHENVKGAVGYARGVIAHYKMNEKQSGDNDELVLNGDFSAWTADNPDGWTVGGESGADPEISEVGTGEGHGGVGTGMCNLYTSDGTNVGIEQTINNLIIGRKYRVSLNVDTLTAGGLNVYDSGTDMWQNKLITGEGIFAFAFVATEVSLLLAIYRLSIEPTDVTFDDVSIKLCAVEDSSGNDHDGLAQQNTSVIHRDGKINGAFDFNGSDFIEIADHDDFTPALTPFSISAWIYMRDTTGFVIASKGVFNTDYEWRLWVDAADKVRFNKADESVVNCYLGRVYDSVLTSYKNQWVHIGVTDDGGVTSAGIRIYLNGIRVDNANSESNPGSFVAVENLAHDIWIGRYSAASFANGLIDNLMFWNHVLSEYVVSRQYQSRFSAYRKRRHGGH